MGLLALSMILKVVTKNWDKGCENTFCQPFPTSKFIFQGCGFCLCDKDGQTVSSRKKITYQVEENNLNGKAGFKRPTTMLMHYRKNSILCVALHSCTA